MRMSMEMNSWAMANSAARKPITTKIHARVDRQGRPLQLLITPGQAHDLTGAEQLLANLSRAEQLVTCGSD